jgi:hypothetical protein
MEKEMTSYGELKKRFLNRAALMKKDLPNELSLIEDMLFYSFDLDNKIRKRLEEGVKKSGKTPRDNIQIITVLFTGTNHFLQGAYDLAIFGLNRPSYSLLRTVFENILHIYMLHLTDGREAYLFIKKCQKNLSKEEEEEFRQKYRYLTAKKVINLLFSEKSKVEQNNFYDDISKSVHKHVRSAIYDTQYNREESKKLLELILLLGTANLWAICDVFLEKINEKQRKSADELVEKIGKHGGNIPNLIPDSENLKSKPGITIYKKMNN